MAKLPKGGLSLTAVVLAHLAATAMSQQGSNNISSSVSWVEDTYFSNLHPAADLAQPDKSWSDVTFVKCAEECSNQLWCSSFFFKPGEIFGVCSLFATVFFERGVLESAPNMAYYRFASDSCPMEDCYFMARGVNLCLSLHIKNNVVFDYDRSLQVCAGNNGGLAILDTKSKYEWVVNMYRIHSKIFPANKWMTVLGGARRTNGEFRWNNGKLLPLSVGTTNVLPGDEVAAFWKPGEPTKCADEDCIYMTYKSHNYSIVDNRCTPQGQTDYFPIGVLCEHH